MVSRLLYIFCFAIFYLAHAGDASRATTTASTTDVVGSGRLLFCVRDYLEQQFLAGRITLAELAQKFPTELLEEVLRNDSQTYLQTKLKNNEISLLELQQRLPRKLLIKVVGPSFHEALLDAITTSDTFLVNELLDQGADADPVLQKVTDSPLFIAVTQEPINTDILLRLLAQGFPVVLTRAGRKIPWSMQPIFKLIQANQSALVELLLDEIPLKQLNDIEGQGREKTLLDLLEKDYEEFKIPRPAYYIMLLRNKGAKTVEEIKNNA